MLRYLALASTLALTNCTSPPAQPQPGVIYETYKGENYESAGWHRAETQEAFEKLEVETYDLYVWDKDKLGNLMVKRECSTPSGDWFFLLDYTYDSSGTLSKIDFEFRTFTGYDPETEDFYPTICIRSYTSAEDGKLKMTSESMRDSETNKEVKRSFWEPEIEHWMSLEEVPKPA